MRARVRDIALPVGTENSFELSECIPEFRADWRTWMLRADCELDGGVSVASYADPCLRGRRHGGGDGLECLALRMLKAGMVKPVRRAPGAKGVKLFTVAKDDYWQRLVWDMREANAVFKQPPGMQMSSVASLAELEVGDPAFFHACATDAPNFFYRLKMPPGFERYVVLEGVDMEYLRRLVRAEGVPHFGPGPSLLEQLDDADALGCVCPPMGFSWAPYLAQRALDHFAEAAGFSEDEHLVHKQKHRGLRPGSCAYMTYLDDFFALAKNTTAALAEADARALLGRITKVMADKGPGHHKDQCSRELTSLGVECHCRDGRVVLFPKAEKFALLVDATLYVAKRGKVKRRALERILGHWTWWLQLNRPLYSIPQEIYRTVLESDDGWVELGDATRRELRYLAALAPFVCADLGLRTCPTVHMVDAGPKFGAVCYAAARGPVEFTADIARCDFPRRQWKVAFAHAWKKAEHNNVGEARAAAWATRRLAHAGVRDRRCVVWSDSQVVIGAFAKGRSGSRALNTLCRRQCALSLLFGLRVQLRYVPSADNFADGPSRGSRYPGVARETAAKAARKRGC